MSNWMPLIGIALAGLACLAAFSWLTANELFGFANKYPGLSDDEFMAKLPKGTSRDTALRVRNIIADQMGVPRQHIHPETRFEEFL